MRRLAFATVLLTAASLTACGGASKTADNPPSSTPRSTASKTPASASTTPSTTATSPGRGSDPGSAYCTELKNAKSRFKNLNFTGLNENQFKNLTAEFDTLAAVAPTEVKADWSTLSGALKQMDSILSSAGLSFKDLQGLTSGHVPKGVTPKDLTRVGRQLQRFAQDSSFQTAASHITAHAESVCGINMGD